MAVRPSRNDLPRHSRRGIDELRDERAEPHSAFGLPISRGTLQHEAAARLGALPAVLDARRRAQQFQPSQIR